MRRIYLNSSRLCLRQISRRTKALQLTFKLYDMKYLFTSTLLLFQLFVQAQIVPPCPSTTTPPSNFCGTSCMYCDLQPMQLSTGQYTPQPAPGFCETVENNLWLGFTASETSILVDILPVNCAQGVEAAVYADCNSQPIACFSGGNTAFTITAQTVIGLDYYLMFDGKNGDNCTFRIEDASGVWAPIIIDPTPPINGPVSVCPGTNSIYTIPPVNGAGFYIWEGPPGSTINGSPSPVTLEVPGGNSVNIVFPTSPSVGIFPICVQPINACSDGQIFCKNVQITPITPTVLPNITVCSDDLPYMLPWGDTVNTTGLYTSTFATATGCDSVIRQFVVVRPPITTVMPPIFLCPGESINMCGTIFNQSGSYHVACTSVNGCDSTIVFSLIVNQLNIWNTITNQASADSIVTGCKSVELECNPIGVNQQFWLNATGDTIGTERNLTVTQSGWYFLHSPTGTFGTVICNNSFADSVYVELGTGEIPVFQARIDTVDCLNGSARLSAQFSGANLGVNWTGPNQFSSTSATISVQTPGRYYIYVIDTVTQCGSRDTSLFVSFLDQKTLRGLVEQDPSQLCDNAQAIEVNRQIGLVAIPVTPNKPSIQFSSNLTGNYNVILAPGSYDISGLYPYELCNPQQVTVDFCPQQQIQEKDFLIKGDYDCPNLNVSLVPTFIRRCFDGGYWLRVQNFGTLATNASVEVDLDSLLIFKSSQPSPSSVNGQKLIYNFGNLAENAVRSVFIDMNVSCNAPLGYEHCTTAHAFPDSACSVWNGPRLELTGQCDGDSVQFIVTNAGVADMNVPSTFHFRSNMSSDSIGEVYLLSGQSRVFRFYADNNTWFTVDQVPNYALNRQLSVNARACQTNMPLVTSLGNQAQHFEYTACTPNTGSFDPNDKQGFPVGLGQEHYIAEGSNISYLIRFQNTGTDTAFTVVIRDTLSSLLNPYSIRPGAATHPYTWKIDTGNVLVFRFNQIMLPDSNTNERLSHGAVEFTIDQAPGNALFAEIYNSAAIYFDFNDPIITNTTKHTNGIPLPTVRVKEPEATQLLDISPNPATHAIQVRGDVFAEGELVNWQIMNELGQVVKSGKNAQYPLNLNTVGLPSGMYRIYVQDEKVTAYGKFIRSH
jgi:uncharacterized repeat protein (TIGR01451 family)